MKVRIGPIVEYDEHEKRWLWWYKKMCPKCKHPTIICKLGGWSMIFCGFYYYFYEKVPPKDIMEKFIECEEKEEDSFYKYFFPQMMYIIGRIEGGNNPLLYDKLLCMYEAMMEKLKEKEENGS